VERLGEIVLTFSLNQQLSISVEVLEKYAQGIKKELSREWLGENYIRCAMNPSYTTENLEGFSLTCSANARMAKNQREVSVLEPGEEMARYAGSGVSENVFADDSVYICNTEFEDEIENLVTEFNEQSEQILVEAGINLYSQVAKALTGNPRVINKLKKVIEAYGIGEMLVKVMRNDVVIKRLGLREELERDLEHRSGIDNMWGNYKNKHSEEEVNYAI